MKSETHEDSSYVFLPLWLLCLRVTGDLFGKNQGNYDQTLIIIIPYRVSNLILNHIKEMKNQATKNIRKDSLQAVSADWPAGWSVMCSFTHRGFIRAEI